MIAVMLDLTPPGFSFPQPILKYLFVKYVLQLLGQKYGGAHGMCTVRYKTHLNSPRIIRRFLGPRSFMQTRWSVCFSKWFFTAVVCSCKTGKSNRLQLHDLFEIFQTSGCDIGYPAVRMPSSHIGNSQR